MSLRSPLPTIISTEGSGSNNHKGILSLSAKANTGVQTSSSWMYNDGNDQVAKMNRFAFPTSTLSPSFPLGSASLSPLNNGGIRGIGTSPTSPRFSLTAALSPRSAYRAPLCSASATGTSPGGLHSSYQGSSPVSPGSSWLGLPSSLESPLPPLSPRGQKLADAEQYHNAKCLNRIVEQRRKASDGTSDIVGSFQSPLPGGHIRRVSFNTSEKGLERDFKAPLPSLTPPLVVHSDVSSWPDLSVSLGDGKENASAQYDVGVAS